MTMSKQHQSRNGSRFASRLGVVGLFLSCGLMVSPVWGQAKPAAAGTAAKGKPVAGGMGAYLQGWQMSGPGSIADVSGGKVSAAVKPGGRLILTQKVEVTPGTVYLLRAMVNGNGAAVASAGALAMSYNKQGSAQLVTGLVRPSTATVTFRLELSSLNDQQAEFEIDPALLSLTPYTLPAAAPARTERHNAATVLTQNGEARAVIVYPGGVAGYEALAKRVQGAVRERTGVTLPMVDDRQATLESGPVLKPEYEKKNLILLGRLGINRALWPAYTQLMAGSDGHYPGAQGYEVRTACNVSHSGANQLIIGCSSDEGMAAAVDRFIALLPKSGASATLTAPFLHDIKLSGPVLEQFNADEALWAQPDSMLVPQIEPGYGTVRRWYQNALGYYWTGRPSYKERMNRELDRVLADKAYTHHYIAEFMIRVFDLLDDTPIFPAEKVAQMDSLILGNFLEFSIGPDLTWMTRFSPPYRNVKIVNRHQVSPWMTDWKVSDFLQSRLPLTGDLANVVRFRHDEKRAFFDYAIANRWAASLPVPQLPESDEETVSSFFRYAFDTGQYDYFTSGRAKNSLLLDRINHLSGHLVRPAGNIDHQLTTGILASYYADGGYAWLNKNLPVAGDVFMGRYVAGVSRFTPGAEVSLVYPTQSLGVSVLKSFDDNVAVYGVLGSGRFASGLTEGEELDFVSMRSGFGPEDDYLGISGIVGAGPPGAVNALASGGVQWLSSGNAGTMTPGSDRYYDNNAVDVARLDQWLGDDRKPYASVAELLWSGSLKSAGGVAYTVKPFMSTQWMRQVVWLAPGLYVFRDTVTPTATGRFSVSVNWHPAAGGSFDGATWTSVSKRGKLRISPVGEGFTFTHNMPEYLAGDTTRPVLRTLREGALTEGEPVVVAHLVESTASKGGPYTLQSTDGCLYGMQKEGKTVGFVSFVPSRLKGVKTDANVLAYTDRGLMILGATFVDVQGTRIFTSKDKADALLPVGTDPGMLSTEMVDKVLTAGTINGERPVIQLGSRESKADRPGVLAANVQTQWQYEGLRQSTRIEPATQGLTGVVDLGMVAELVEIRAVRSGRFWSVSPMPEVWLSEGDADGAMPSADAPGATWVKVTQTPQWHPAVQTGNYGKAEGVAEAYQSVILPGTKARYVKFSPGAKLLFFDGRRPGLRGPAVIQTGLAGGRVLVTGDYKPPFVRASQEQTNLLCVLTGDGKAVYRDEPGMAMQEAHATAGPLGPDSVGVLSVDAQMRWLRPDGTTGKSADMQKMHADFNEKYGQPNTRSPAGGFTMPFNFGSWRAGPDGRAKTVVARYGALTFLNEDAQFEGVNMTGGYVIAGVLPKGVDFDGDGTEEQLALARGVLVRISGEPTPKVKNPGSAITYPEAYETRNLPEPDFDARINGAPVHAFEAINNRFVLVVRENYMGVYDGKTHAWSTTWTPLVPIRSGALVRDSAGKSYVLLQTFDGLLYRLWWEGEPVGTPQFACAGFADSITRISSVQGSTGLALLVCRNGLYLHGPQGQITRVSEQGWSDAKASVEGGQVKVTGIDLTGTVKMLSLPVP